MTRDEVREIVRRDYADRTVREIAEEVGLSRSAVIGLAHRMGLRANRPNRGGWRRNTKRASRPPVKVSAPPAQPRALLELRAGTCRWPLDDGLFCAAPATHERYCAKHWRRAHLRRDDACQSSLMRSS